MKDLQRYCEKCGEKMEKKRKFEGYDLGNGKKAYEVWWECPCRSGGIRGWLNGHTKFGSNYRELEE